MSEVTVLESGPYTIVWRGGATFNVWLHDRNVNVFTSYGADDEATARQTAADWWNDGGKEATQEIVREDNY